ncbi:MaoC/PaaZ C-terminal domain-containing protein [Actinocorallia aurea]
MIDGSARPPGTDESAGAWAGRHLGERTVTWTERDAVLYALAVGAQAEELDLVYERRLRVLPTFGLTLAQWAPDALGGLGAFDVGTTLHGAQRLEVAAPLPPRGETTLSARVAAVWDKGTAAVFEVEVESPYFTATWSLFAPGRGGFGGERGPSAASSPDGPGDDLRTSVPTFPEQAVLYRLCGDKHALHVDPEAARAAGMDRPILHGLCTMAAAGVGLARAMDEHPADLREIGVRFTAPVIPGDVLEVGASRSGRAAAFSVEVAGRTVLRGGTIGFGS